MSCERKGQDKPIPWCGEKPEPAKMATQVIEITVIQEQVKPARTKPDDQHIVQQVIEITVHWGQVNSKNKTRWLTYSTASDRNHSELGISKQQEQNKMPKVLCR